jgi:hypothetical protein
MKTLPNESLPLRLKNDFGEEHAIWSVREKSLLGKINGALLWLKTEDKLELFITVDKNLPYQQNLKSFPLTIAMLLAKDKRHETLRLLIPNIFLILLERENQNAIEIF